MTENKRVVITGMGALSPIGNDAQTNWENALKVSMELIQLHALILKNITFT